MNYTQVKVSLPLHFSGFTQTTYVSLFVPLPHIPTLLTAKPTAPLSAAASRGRAEHQSLADILA